jgi:perosamine synthetase
MNQHFVPLSGITLAGNELKYVADAVNSTWISGQGKYVSRFEEMLAEVVGRRYCIAVTNGTVAIELSLLALGIGAGDEVIVPALTFAAPAAAVMAVGARPVFVDVNRSTWTLDISGVKKAIGEATKAIIAVDLLGHPCDYDALSLFGVPIIEDAAEAHGAYYKGNPVGSFGLVSTFSFHANKTITTGEGGCVLTDDPRLHAQMRLIANHGMSKERLYWHEVVGHNFRMTNLTAAIGCAQIERWTTLVESRNQLALEYDQVIGTSDLRRRPVAEWATEACWLYCLTSSCRQEVLAGLVSRGIDARAVWTVLPECPVFSGCKTVGFEIAAKIARECPVLRNVHTFNY